MSYETVVRHLSLAAVFPDEWPYNVELRQRGKYRTVPATESHCCGGAKEGYIYKEERILFSYYCERESFIERERDIFSGTFVGKKETKLQLSVL